MRLQRGSSIYVPPNLCIKNLSLTYTNTVVILFSRTKTSTVRLTLGSHNDEQKKKKENKEKEANLAHSNVCRDTGECKQRRLSPMSPRDDVFVRSTRQIVRTGTTVVGY